MGLVVQNIVRLTKLLGDDLLSFTIVTKLLAVIFFAEKLLGNSYCIQYVWKFSISLLYGLVSFEQPGPSLLKRNK